LQPGGHRFEPGILHQRLPAIRAQAAERRIGSLTTEYPANGSFCHGNYDTELRVREGVEAQCLNEGLMELRWLSSERYCVSVEMWSSY
jgi:hypothetical protein